MKLIRRHVLLVSLLLLISTPAIAFLYEVQVMTAKELDTLSDNELIQLYTDALIERAASQTFHGRAGFSPKEYKSYKELLGLIVRIRQEMLLREVEVPPIEEWLR